MSNIIIMHVPVVINSAIGGYQLTEAAQLELAKRKGISVRVVDSSVFVGDSWETVDEVVPRNDPHLVALVREWGTRAGADLKVVEVEVSMHLRSHGGRETVVVSGGRFT